MSKEQQELVDEAYKNYIYNPDYKAEGVADLMGSQAGQLVKCPTIEDFINKCKTDLEFSNKWGLKIEEQELNLDERAKLHPNPENFYEIHGTFSISDSIEDSNFLDKDWLHEQFDNGGIPTKLITITYNDKTIDSYE
jgi:hypothetical protein